MNKGAIQRPNWASTSPLRWPIDVAEVPAREEAGQHWIWPSVCQCLVSAKGLEKEVEAGLEAFLMRGWATCVWKGCGSRIQNLCWILTHTPPTAWPSRGCLDLHHLFGCQFKVVNLYTFLGADLHSPIRATATILELRGIDFPCLRLCCKQPKSFTGYITGQNKN